MARTRRNGIGDTPYQTVLTILTTIHLMGLYQDKVIEIRAGSGFFTKGRPWPRETSA